MGIACSDEATKWRSECPPIPNPKSSTGSRNLILPLSLSLYVSLVLSLLLFLSANPPLPSENNLSLFCKWLTILVMAVEWSSGESGVPRGHTVPELPGSPMMMMLAEGNFIKIGFNSISVESSDMQMSGTTIRRKGACRLHPSIWSFSPSSSHFSTWIWSWETPRPLTRPANWIYKSENGTSSWRNSILCGRKSEDSSKVHMQSNRIDYSGIE